jgi:hypothetical protein
MEKDQKVQRNQNQSGRENKSDNPDEHGVISTVQSPDEEESEPVRENKSDDQDEHGIISIVQSPDEEKNKKEPMPKSPTMSNQKQDHSQHRGMNHKGSNKGMPKAKFANVNEPEEEMLDDDSEETNLYEDGSLQEKDVNPTTETTRKGRM